MTSLGHIVSVPDLLLGAAILKTSRPAEASASAAPPAMPPAQSGISASVVSQSEEERRIFTRLARQLPGVNLALAKSLREEASRHLVLPEQAVSVLISVKDQIDLMNMEAGYRREALYQRSFSLHGYESPSEEYYVCKKEIETRQAAMELLDYRGTELEVISYIASARISELQTQLQVTTQESNERQAKIEELQAQCNKNEQELREVQMERVRMREQIEDLENSNRALQDSINESRAELQGVKINHNRLTEKLEDMEASFNVTKARLRSKITRLRLEINRLHSEQS